VARVAPPVLSPWTELRVLIARVPDDDPIHLDETDVARLRLIVTIPVRTICRSRCPASALAAMPLE
jgi:hypothetical protein